ncbi:hypothetical protein BDN70DRAFT_888345 [Pholiota conissans]|uniref:F-box domain-containing protein n=1 Tax=Pholiota conissans TaxID=109636 RepID=A0A9P5YNX1_9AGAR|nr:hypothetical protein BDN70DRAFT_888345 [Pholiota conissans]
MPLPSQRVGIESKTERRARIDLGLGRTDKKTLTLLKKRAALCRERNTLSPAVDLPIEILETIFEFACCQHDAPNCFDAIVDQFFDFGLTPSKKDTRSRLTDTPMSFGSVCSAWRNAISGAARLWSNIEIYFD